MNTTFHCPNAIFEHGRWLCHHNCKLSNHVRFSVKCKYGMSCTRGNTCTFFHPGRQFSEERSTGSDSNIKSFFDGHISDFDNIVNQMKEYNNNVKKEKENLINENKQLKDKNHRLEIELNKYQEGYNDLKDKYIKKENLSNLDQIMLSFMYQIRDSDNLNMKQRFIRYLFAVAHPQSGGNDTLCHLVGSLKTEFKLE